MMPHLSCFRSSVLRPVNSERLRGSREVQSAEEVKKNGESLKKILGQVNALLSWGVQ